MELAQKYVYEVYKAKNFSKAASNLFISQPALSATVKKLEKALGFMIFDRSQTPLFLTQEGRIYIEYLEECIENERIMHSRINSLTGKPPEMLLIGGGNFLARTLFPKACRELRRVASDVTVKMDMGESSDRHLIEEKLRNGVLDLALTYYFDPKECVGIPLHVENFFLAMRPELEGAEELLPHAVSMNELLFGDRDFVSQTPVYEIPSRLPLLRSAKIPQSQVYLSDYNAQFTDANYHALNSRSIEMHYNMMLAGLGATIVTDVVVALKRHLSEGVVFVPVNTPIHTRTAYVAYKKSKTPSESAERFISILKDMCADKKQLLNILAT